MMTLKHSTHQSTLGLIYSPEDSLASHTVSQEHSRTTMTVNSGQKCLESYRNVSPLGSLVRMCLESSTWHSTESSLIWKKKITKSNRLLFQLAPSMRRTSETGFGLWPTPNARDYKDSMGMNFVGGGGGPRKRLDQVPRIVFWIFGQLLRQANTSTGCKEAANNPNV